MTAGRDGERRDEHDGPARLQPKHGTRAVTGLLHTLHPPPIPASDFVGMPEPKSFEAVAHACHECQDFCLRCMVHCLRRGGMHASLEHQTAMMDCAAICGLLHELLHRQSPHAQHLCIECAEICNACADSCSKMGGGDEMMTNCAKMCRMCADACTQLKP